MKTTSLFQVVVWSLTVALLAGCPGKPCEAGTSGCPCKASDVCNDALVCSAEKTCGLGTVAGIQVSDPAARGCEVLLTESAGTVVRSLNFQDGVVGSFVVEAPRTAVSFVAPKDAALPGSGVQLVLSGPSSGVSVTRASCVDGKGQKLPGAAVTLR